MAIQHSNVFPLLIMLILAVSHLSDGRQIPRISSEEAHQISVEFALRSSNDFSAAAAAAGASPNEADPVYGASYRTVPAGPNPLHN
ncbi:hypothetical protein Vadar_027619 [Vaccinium darrowii]|uniref:Uncharacterized protein n=1 Tax=Vaccinium darrowii TaxID=229202 RepID=A0ACB7ZFA6_9ERIC|nr:hypothetical protein Vadar_027619 [Vaccinium darrowii]